MVTEHVVAIRRSLRDAADADGQPALPDRLAQVFAAARAWDESDEMPVRGSMPPPRGGWLRCFEAAAARGFTPRSALAITD